MLFDLRSRGRRRTVQVIYLGLALLMMGGLVLFGVGAGNGIGGLLNAFTNGSSNSGQSQAVNAQTKAALRAVHNNPNSTAAWGSLVQARWTAAGQGSNFDSTTSSYTASGKQELAKALVAWNHYLKLSKTPDQGISTLAAEAAVLLGHYPSAANAWEYVAQTQPSEKAFYCLAATAYAAGQTTKGNLATAKTLQMTPKSQRLTVAASLKQAKTNPAVAQTC
jgi:hypothetical protein